MTNKVIGLASSNLGAEKINKRKVLNINAPLTYQNCEEVEATFKDYLD